MSIEGGLDIRLHLDGRRVGMVDIHSTRPVHASRLMVGKTVEEALQLLPVLFNVCGTAQAAAGVRACEAALGRSASVDAEALRNRLVAMETLREHLWRIFLEWPPFYGGEVDKTHLREMIELLGGYRGAGTVDGEPFAIGFQGGWREGAEIASIHHRLERWLEQHLFGMPPADWLGLNSLVHLRQWMEDHGTVAASYLRRLGGSGWYGSGTVDTTPLGDLDEGRLQGFMDEEAFVGRPQWDGRCCETSSFTRTDTPLLTAIEAEYGAGLLARVVALLSEVAQLVGWLQNGRVAQTTAVHHSNPGIGQAEAARGLLVHRVELEKDRVARYQILAPTEWNFHPRGVVARSLAALDGGAREVEAQAHLLVRVIDPCVGYRLRVEEGVPARA